MPSRTHYATFTQVKSRLKTESDVAALKTRIRDLIAESSRFLDSETKRRFDWYYDTGKFNAVRKCNGGDVDGLKVWLDRDLIQFDTVTRDGETISNSNLFGYPTWRDTPAYAAVEHTDENFSWLSRIQGSPRNKIQITGIWGYGGRWQASGATATVADETTTTLTMSTASHGVEQESVIRVGTEFMRVAADSEDTSVVVERGYNGSTATDHTGVAVEIFHPETGVKRVIGRMVAWFSALQKNPMYGTQAVGDIEFPVDLTQFPKDIQHSISQLIKPGGF